MTARTVCLQTARSDSVATVVTPPRAKSTYRLARGDAALLLGMVFSEEMEPKRGQEYRDRVRCEAMESLGYSVFTLDNKHDEDAIATGKHCTANFADARRMFKSIRDRFGPRKSFELVILDYFFCPAGWARERWTENLFRDTLPQFAWDNVLTADGQIWLPNLKCVQELLAAYKKQLGKYFEWELVGDAKANPLYRATEKVEKELLMCPDSLTNETQIRPLNDFSDTPFYVLTRKHDAPRGEPASNIYVDADEDSSPKKLSPKKRRLKL